ncbi:uncharacterized protein LOC129972075 [Argiope bruennichi]|uniref:uncharacterized protein LOC129972075 n=1 Tax=Argiope bruennichi TaxID=94029 RepID=UPI002493D624|nr:uncharacterized protein LOC129972075 [Argiope bruennichi]
MAFIAKARKCDLQELASELGEEIDGNLTIANLRKLILNSNEYEEEFVKGVLEGIVERRQEKENLERQEKERQFELEKIKLQTSIETQSIISENNEMSNKHNSLELQKILQKFNSKNDDISLYLVIFERQAKRLKIDKTDWVTQLMPLLPSDVVQIIAREPEEESNVYEYVKELLLRRFKLSAETFRLRFVQHQKRMESSWRDLAFELRSFLEEWLDGIKVKDFESLKDLMVVDQIKRRVGNEVREHFVDTWTKISSSSKLADLLDDYDSVRRSSKTGHIPSNDRKRTNGNFEKKSPIAHDKNAVNIDYKRPSSPRNWKRERSDRRQCFECGSSQHLRAQCPKLAEKKNFSRINHVTRRLVETTSEKSGSQRFPENVTENQTDEGRILTTQLKAPEKDITRISPPQKIPVKIEDNAFEGIVDTGAEITVIRQDIIDSCAKQEEGSIKIISAFGEEELAPLVTMNVKINDGKHGNVPVTCAASRKLVRDMLISSTVYEALCKKIEVHTLPVINNDDSEQPVHEEPNQEEESPLQEKKCFLKLQKGDGSLKMEDGTNKEIHVNNKIRPYIARLEQVGVIYDQDNEFGEIFPAPTNCNQKSQINRDIRTQIYNQKEELSLQQKAELIHILSKYSDSFSKFPGEAKVPGHNIKVTDDCVPKRLAPYRVPIVLQGEVERQVQELLEAGLIEHSESDWAHPVVCVAKKNGSIRLCVDYRQLNKYTIADAYPMKLVTELLYEIGKANFISILDLTKGYWQIPMKPEAKHYTAFITHSGLYQWNVMPFGMKNAGSTFQRSMDKILSKHREYCRAYIDDVAIFSKSWKEHKKHIMEVFCTLQESNLTINLEKCEFGKKEVKFLGHIVGSGRHFPDPEKIEAIKKLLRPTNKKEVRSLLGLANYYRDYIPNFSSLVLPLTNLTKKNVPNEIPWAKEQEQAFQILKEELVKMPSLYTPQLDKPFQLYTDASATAVGACLAQIGDDGKEKPIAFFSKKLTATQTRWATIEREAYAVLVALKKYDTWIFGARVQVISDHNPLTYLTQQTPHSAKLARWSLALQRYDVTISYRKGSKHCNADSLSRLPLQQ